MNYSLPRTPLNSPLLSFYKSNFPSLAFLIDYSILLSVIKVLTLRLGNKPLGPKNLAYGFNYLIPSAVANNVSNSIISLSHY